MEADQIGRLRDILEAARLIGSYLTGASEAGFLANREKQDAAIWRIEIIGEATSHLNETTREATPNSPFGKCVAWTPQLHKQPIFHRLVRIVNDLNCGREKISTWNRN